MTRDELARAVLALLDAQKCYFRLRAEDPGKKMALITCKAAEIELRQECLAIVLIAEAPTLFPEDK